MGKKYYLYLSFISCENDLKIRNVTELKQIKNVQTSLTLSQMDGVEEYNPYTHISSLTLLI